MCPHESHILEFIFQFIQFFINLKRTFFSIKYIFVKLCFYINDVICIKFYRSLHKTKFENSTVFINFCYQIIHTFFYSICKVIFQQKTACFHLISIQCVIHVCRHKYNRKFWVFFFDPHSCFQPIHPLHIDIQK